ncbi:MAG TPA: hypothetical protein VI341_04125 [Actinomycetota bacterium]
MIWRRKRLPAELAGPFESFTAVLAEIEPAKRALTMVMPTTRLPGTPLPDALFEFEAGIGRAQVLMPDWRVAPVDTEWVACDAGLTEGLERARRLREEAPDLGGFEGLIWAVERLLDPLEPFEAAATRFRSLRVAGM